MIHYHVHMDAPHTHTFTVHMHIPASGADILTVCLPVWTPGSYLIREYAKNINALHATVDMQPCKAKKLNKHSWQIHTQGKACVVTYDVYAFEESVRTCWLDDVHASIIPAALFLRNAAHDHACTIHLDPYPAFKEIATALPPVQNDIWTRFASDTDTLYDSPIEIGNHSTHHFQAAGINHTLVVSGSGNYQIPPMIDDFIRIIETEVKIFEHHPCPSYLTILQTSNTMRGGLEHKDSTSLIYKRLMFEPRDNYRDFLSLFAHEYFHLWNVKRLRPKALGPFNYQEENYTSSLWIAEGFTSYYDDLIVYRAGLYTEQQYLRVIEKNLTQAENAPGKHVQSIAEASFDAWIKYYRQNENSENNQVNYYVRGSVLATMLDILIIHHSGARYCLDQVMREAYLRFYVNADTGYTEEEFRAVLEQFAGIDLSDWYANHVFGTTSLPLEDTFALVGLTLNNTLSNTIEPDMGITLNERSIITAVRKNSGAAMGGLYVQDEILAINGYRMQNGLLATMLSGKAVGETLTFTVSRYGLLKEVTARIMQTDKVDYILTPAADATTTQQRNYAKWLFR